MTTDGPPAVLSVRDLQVRTCGGAAVVQQVSFDLRPGEVLGVVGESGCGKTTMAMALLGHAARGLGITGGEVVLDGRELLGEGEARLRRIRGREISYVSQEPAATLNPSLRVHEVVGEPLRGVEKEVTRQRVRTALREVDLPDEDSFLRRYPHELSGGQQQRAAIAAAMVARPKVLVLDEPTTGLDVLTEAKTISSLKTLRDQSGVAMVYVTHDLRVLRELADRVTILYAGLVVEEGEVGAVLTRPRHPYTKGLIDALPDHRRRLIPLGIPGAAPGPGEAGAGCPFATRCELKVGSCAVELPSLMALGSDHLVRCTEHGRVATGAAPSHTVAAWSAGESPLLEVEALEVSLGVRRKRVSVVRGISLQIAPGEVLGVVGESGSGKTTLARAIAGLTPATSGRVLHAGEELARDVSQRPRQRLRDLQMVFQNPYLALSPRRRVRSIVARPAQLLRELSRDEASREAERMLELVRLPAPVADRYPRELSGGQRQRVAIAQALVTRPDVLICDEITSALDVSVQAGMIELLTELQRDFRMALLFVSHDIGVVGTLADRLLVIRDGEVVEQGPCEAILASPRTDYTRRLLDAAPGAINGRSPGSPTVVRTQMPGSADAARA